MQNGSSRTLFIIDLTIMFAFFYMVFAQYYGHAMIPVKGLILMGIIVIYWFLISVNADILKISPLSGKTRLLKDTLIAYSLLSTLTIATVAIFGQFRPNDKLILYPLLYSFIMSSILRLSFVILIKHFSRHGYRYKSVLLIGSGRSAQLVISKILSDPALGFRLQGLLCDNAPPPPLNKLFLGAIADFPDILRRYRIDEVIIAKPLSEVNTIRRIVKCCEEKGLRFYIVPDFYNIIPKWTVINSLGDLPVVAACNEPLNIFGNLMMKRAFDILVAAAGLLVLAPILLIIALGVKISSPGPILFRQKRIGNNNREFTLFKFRSMIVQPCRDSDTRWTQLDDRRVTPFGRFLRRTNLDELPQLWNVLTGDMSIVGPRPEREHFVEKFSLEIPNYRIRHRIKSGITGLAQANGWRGDTSIKMRIENDLYYLENWSLWLDLKIIFLTFFSRAAWKNAI
jgi:Undecaprenyl-phosphate glucose phosphotransferase